MNEENQQQTVFENKFYKVIIEKIELDGEYLQFFGTVLDKRQDKTFEFDDYTDLSDFCVEYYDDGEIDDGTDNIDCDTKEGKMRVENKVVIITGASSGIGKETALLFAKEGAKVVVTDINENGGLETVGEIVYNGGEAFFAKLDTSNRDQSRDVVQNVLDRYGKVDVLINNAGIIQDSLISKMTEDQWDKVIEVDLKGPFNCIQAVVDAMEEHGTGEIINVSSIVGLYGNIGQANYASAKAGLIGLTKTLAKELGRKGIRVNAVAPGFIHTPMTEKVPDKILDIMKEKTPLKRLGRPDDVAHALLYLASDDANFVNGAVINIDGGLLI